ncbi:polysaccharide biosynthesis/export family protein [Geobacter pelophilus]|uniref:Polysaccharide biosynthesis/export family protein n=2 Tax=Geoanaerobacter pelophilus TaxID=60036 RepID=A0AAW4L9G8_9BACT|nr:polysaccharide biosynthesis/export family protein [Geoanaerobacter pelophilus]
MLVVTSISWAEQFKDQGQPSEAVKADEPKVKAPAVVAPGSSIPDSAARNTSDAVVSGNVSEIPLVKAADYLIGPGDQLDIAVWKDEALTRSVVVLPDGKVTFPLAGDILAGGKTVAELKKEISERLARFVPDLVLSVEVRQSNSMLIYIIGRVNAPGRQVLNTNVNVLQALAMAGGLNPFASKDRIKVFRTEHGETRIIPFHYSEVVDGTNLADNIVLKRGDVIVVP